MPKPVEENFFLQKSLFGLYVGSAMFLSVMIVGIIAYKTEGWGFSDAIYMVVITVFSVGYEEVQPVNTIALRVITVLIIVAGDASKVYFVGSLIQFITGGEIGKAMEQHRKSREIDNIKDHAIVCGYGRFGQTLARELTSKKFPFLIIDNSPERVEMAHSHGFLALVGDAGDEECLTAARIQRAVVLATVLPSDTVNLFITLTARNMRPDIKIIARAEDPATEKKLRQAGANEVTLPAFIGGIQIANSITRPSMDSVLTGTVGLINNDLKALGVLILEHRILPGGVDDRKTLHQLIKGIEEACLVLAVKRAGELIQHPQANFRLEGNDVVTFIAREKTKLGSEITYKDSPVSAAPVA